MDKITEKFHDTSDSDSDKKEQPKIIQEPSKHNNNNNNNNNSSRLFEAKVFRLFGRQKPIHKVFGGGKPADIFLWRNKKVSAGVVGGVTTIWVLFELLEYHLLTLICHILIASLATLFIWSSATTFFTKSPPHIPEVQLPEELFLQVVSALRIEINGGLAVLRNIASGKDLKKFLGVIAGLWIMSILGGCCNFLTLFYIAFVLLHTVPVIYEKYEDTVDSYAEKAMHEIKKQYAVFDAKVLSKIPRGPLKNKKVA